MESLLFSSLYSVSLSSRVWELHSGEVQHSSGPVGDDAGLERGRVTSQLDREPLLVGLHAYGRLPLSSVRRKQHHEGVLQAGSRASSLIWRDNWRSWITDGQKINRKSNFLKQTRQTCINYLGGAVHEIIS